MSEPQTKWVAMDKNCHIYDRSIFDSDEDVLLWMRENWNRPYISRVGMQPVCVRVEEVEGE